METKPMVPFGPVPSRRLGRSLGINHIPPKICTYSCVYCQLGRTHKMQVARQGFYDPELVRGSVADWVQRARDAGEAIDYLTFVPDGEPTLDSFLGREIDLLKPLGLPIAVITNSSLLGQPEVRQGLMAADWVSVKVDSALEEVWRRVDRPHRSLTLDSILRGIEALAGEYGGKLVTETMLVANVNDGEESLRATAEFIAGLKVERAYLAVPTRPPAEDWAQPPAEQALHRAYQIFREQMEEVETLIGYEGNAFAFTGDVEEDLLSITAVHPMREGAVSEVLARAGSEWAVVHRLVAQGELVELEHGGHRFYLRKLRAPGERA